MPNNMKKVEEYLMQLWKRGSNCQTMDHLKLWLYHHSKTGLVLNELPQPVDVPKGIYSEPIITPRPICKFTALTKHAPDLHKQLFGFEVVDNMLMPKN